MRPEEAAWVGRQLGQLDDSEIATVLNIGSSTGHFRTITQPHIESEIFAPLSARGARVIHSDVKHADGVDLVGDLLDPAFRAKVVSMRADVVLANNLFEHVADRASLAECLSIIPRPGGRLIVTVPCRFPYHADPIDTLYRPTPEEIAHMFPAFSAEAEAIIETTTLWEDLEAKLGSGGAKRNVARRCIRALFPFYRPRAWLATLASIAWLHQPRSVSAISLVKWRSDVSGVGA
jgi:SAM-dependent methyltransferase